MKEDKQMKLEKLIKETEALTYINSLKVTLTEIKDQVSEIEQHKEYTTLACEKVRRLVRRADNQYRLIAKLAQGSSTTIATNVSIEDSANEELKNIMEDVDNAG